MKNALYSLVFGVHLKQNLIYKDQPPPSCLIFIFPFLKYPYFTINVGLTKFLITYTDLDVRNKVSPTQSNENYYLLYSFSLSRVNVLQL